MYVSPSIFGYRVDKQTNASLRYATPMGNNARESPLTAVGLSHAVLIQCVIMKNDSI